MERLEHRAVAKNAANTKEGFLATLGMTSGWLDRRGRLRDRAVLSVSRSIRTPIMSFRTEQADAFSSRFVLSVSRSIRTPTTSFRTEQADSFLPFILVKGRPAQ